MKPHLLALGFASLWLGCGGDETKPSLVFAVEPNVLSVDMSATLTVYFSPPSKTAKPPTSVSVEVNGTTKKIALSNVTPVEGHDGQVQATVDAGQLDASSYDVVLGDGGKLANGLLVVSQADITVAKVSPPFGDPAVDTAITITTSGYQLLDTPRVYLSQGGQATELRAVALQSPTSVTAVVPANTLAAGDYDVIITDPIDAAGGHIAELTGGFHLVASPPNVITVSPTTLLSATTTTVTVSGSGFAAGATAYLSECTAPAGVTTPVTPLSLGAAANVSPTSLQVTIPGGTMAASVACVLRIVNGAPTDAANPCPAGAACLPYSDYSALAATTNSGDLGTFATTMPLLNPRRALGAVSGHASGQAKFLYVIGGDDGTAANARDDIESTQLDSLGGMLGWTTQVHKLTTKRTYIAATRVGQFVYVLGGSDGANALASVERARILDPLDVPAVPDLDLTPDKSGVAAGGWVYRITGVRDAAYPSDPGGETLASDPLSITVPDLSKNAAAPLAKVTLTWPKMDNVVSYNIYRTPAADQAASQVQLIGNVAQPTDTSTTVAFDDTGLAASGQSPLPTGSLGNWHHVGDMTMPRVGAAAVAAAGGSTGTTDTWYLYVGGGAPDAAFTTLDGSYEWARIDLDKATGAQTVGAFTAGASIGAGRAFLTAYAVDAVTDPHVNAGTTWVYFGTGTGGPSGVTKISVTAAGEVDSASTSGTLAGLVTNLTTSNAGGGAYTAFSSTSNTGATTAYLFTFGGWTSASSIINTDAASICPATSCNSGTPPTLTNWSNGGGGTPIVPRVLSKAVIEQPFIYILGGSTVPAANNASTGTERTVW